MDQEEKDKAQHEQQLLEEAFAYRTEGKYPEGASDNKKRVIRKKANKFEVKDGELFYKQNYKKVRHSYHCCLYTVATCRSIIIAFTVYDI